MCSVALGVGEIGKKMRVTLFRVDEASGHKVANIRYLVCTDQVNIWARSSKLCK